MAAHKERRNHPRRVGQGLVVMIEGRGFPLVNISISGVSFQSTAFKTGDEVTVIIAQLMNPKESVETRLKVVNVQGSIVHGEFFSTMRLMRYIVLHMADVTGYEPEYFK